MGGSMMKSEYTVGAKKRLVVSAQPAAGGQGQADSTGNVDHVVSGEVDGVAFEVMVAARDALWALSMVSTMPEHEFLALRRVESGVPA